MSAKAADQVNARGASANKSHLSYNQQKRREINTAATSNTDGAGNPRQKLHTAIPKGHRRGFSMNNTHVRAGAAVPEDYIRAHTLTAADERDTVGATDLNSDTNTLTFWRGNELLLSSPGDPHTVVSGQSQRGGTQHLSMQARNAQMRSDVKMQN